jgi:two-component system, chemotaxis family, protein-glutamate methylesterase/glutaminase
MNDIRVLVVDDSAAVRAMLLRELSACEGITACSAGNVHEAEAVLEEGCIDVVTLDMGMPYMDSLSFLAGLMEKEPVPVIAMSSLAAQDRESAVEALELGAAGVVHKPGGPFSVEDVIGELEGMIRSAAVLPAGSVTAVSRRLKARAETAVWKGRLPPVHWTDGIIAAGAGEGGVPAFEALFMHLPPDFPPVLAVIHMPEDFTGSFAGRLDRLCAVHVKLASDGEDVLPGTVYLAPGGHVMQVGKQGTRRVLRIRSMHDQGGLSSAADVLFISAAAAAGSRCTAVLLTGAGADGARGMKAVRDAGGFTIAQDEATSLFFDMPRHALSLGAVCQSAPLSSIPLLIAQKNTGV